MPADVVPASRKLGRADAAALAGKASKVIVAKGKKVSEFTIKGPPRDEVVDAMLGPTGNLRAPTLRAGRTLLVGFDQAQYEKVLL